MPAISPISFTEISRIHANALGSGKCAVAVTASRDGEGSTLSAHALALRSAENGMKTLLIDMNMRNKGLTEEADFQPVEWKLSKRKKDDTLKDLCLESPNNKKLFYMPVAKDQESIDFLRDGVNMARTVKTLKKGFDHVIIDTTPVGVANRYNVDAVTVATAVDGVVLVMLAGVTTKSKIKGALNQLDEAGAKIKGVVVNDYRNPSAKEGLLKLANAFGKINPGFAGWLKHRITHADSLN